MTPDHRAKLEQQARAWVDVNGLGRHPYSNEMVGSLANLLASRDVAVLEEVANQIDVYAQHDVPPSDEVDVMFEGFIKLLVDNIRQQAKERRP